MPPGRNTVQGTVKDFSDETRSGSVVLDDGTTFPITPQAFSSSGLRSLRFGQRVRFEVADDKVVSITLATF